MPIYYEEFDTTQATLVTDLVAKITAHPDWSVYAPTMLSTTLSASVSTSSMTLNFSSPMPLFVGQRLLITSGTRTWRKTVVSVIDSTQVTVSAGAWGITLPSGTTTVVTEATLLKATTTRGAEMIVDLTAGDEASELYRMNLRFWQQLGTDYATATPLNSVERYLYFRASGGTTTQTLHVTLSVSKEHLFVAVEGPRAHEAGTFSTTYGSVKNYLFACDVVPYHSSDSVPSYVATSGTVPTAAASVNSQAHIADLSRNAANTESWQGCRLASLTFPTVWETATVAVERDCTIDGNKYLFPYVVFGNKEGIRGRLRSFFYAGSTAPTSYADTSAPVGEKVTFDGVVYKLVAVNKGDGTTDSWGAFGAADNGNATAGRSVVVAVPFADEVVTP